MGVLLMPHTTPVRAVQRGSLAKWTGAGLFAAVTRGRAEL